MPLGDGGSFYIYQARLHTAGGNMDTYGIPINNQVQRKVENAKPKGRGWGLYRVLHTHFLKYFLFLN